tara:strand:+ start:394 stop:717 length:324 start_codon:yes stop_codon:yes gene_type:complete
LQVENDKGEAIGKPEDVSLGIAGTLDAFYILQQLVDIGKILAANALGTQTRALQANAHDELVAALRAGIYEASYVVDLHSKGGPNSVSTRLTAAIKTMDEALQKARK